MVCDWKIMGQLEMGFTRASDFNVSLGFLDVWLELGHPSYHRWKMEIARKDPFSSFISFVVICPFLHIL